MKLKNLPTLCAMAFVAIGTIPTAAFAIEPAWVGARAGTGGLGAEVGVRIVPTVVVRGIVQAYDFDYDVDTNNIGYAGTFNLGSYGAQIDWRPPLVPLYLTAGIFANNNEIDLSATPTGAVTLGNSTYSASQIGRLNGQAEFDKTALYGGLGVKFGLGPLEAALEGGLYYQGSPKTSLSATGSLASNPAFQADLAREAASVADELDSAAYWPMVTLHARWKF